MTCFTKKQEPVKNMGDVTTLWAFSYLRISDRDLLGKHSRIGFSCQV